MDTSFTPIAGLVGGSLIGIAVALVLLFSGRIAGISGIMGGLLLPKAGDVAWRGAFVGGLVSGGLLLVFAYPSAFPSAGWQAPWWLLTLGGLLVGFGTRMGNGCTSGHGICGIARFSLRSLVATLTFLGVAAVVVFILRHVFK